MDRFLLAVEFTNSVRNNLPGVKSEPFQDFWQPTSTVCGSISIRTKLASICGGGERWCDHSLDMPFTVTVRDNWTGT